MPAEPRTCVEIGSLVFAFVNCIIVFAACVVSSVGVFVEMILIIKNGIRPNRDSSYVITAILVATLILSSIALAFSFLLCKGLLKKNARYVKAYLIYGVIVMYLMLGAGVVSILIFAGLMEVEHLIIIGSSTFGACMLYSTILGMIYATYKNYRQDISRSIPLENCNCTTTVVI